MLVARIPKKLRVPLASVLLLLGAWFLVNSYAPVRPVPLGAGIGCIVLAWYIYRNREEE